MAKTWYPVIDYLTCVECGTCVAKCPHGVFDTAKAPSPIVKNPELNEAAATKHTINVLLATVSENMGSLNFNDLLPTNYENDIYNLNEPDLFNKNEENFAKSIRLDKVSGGNGIYAMLKQLITNETIAGALKNANIKKCMEQINYLHSEKGNKESPDRNMFLYFGVIRAICSTLNNLDDDIKETEAKEVTQDVFLKVFFDKPHLKSIEHFKYFLFKSLKNRLYDLFKSKSFLS